jgi:hypothetical protein
MDRQFVENSPRCSSSGWRIQPILEYLLTQGDAIPSPILWVAYERASPEAKKNSLAQRQRHRQPLITDTIIARDASARRHRKRDLDSAWRSSAICRFRREARRSMPRLAISNRASMRRRMEGGRRCPDTNADVKRLTNSLAISSAMAAIHRAMAVAAMRRNDRRRTRRSRLARRSPGRATFLINSFAARRFELKSKRFAAPAYRRADDLRACSPRS